MGEFDLDLGRIEQDLAGDEAGRVVLGVLGEDAAGKDWLGEIRQGRVLVLAVDGDLNQVGHEFATGVKDFGGSLVHFRGFLIATPPGITVDTSNLSAAPTE